jgi:hypothetical protein
MTREQALRKWRSLTAMVVERGCSVHEAATAARLASVLARKWGFGDSPGRAHERPDFDVRYTRAEQRAAVRFAWEYRRCGKQNCHCAGRGTFRHGPYKYGKKREGRKVRSVYLGRC